MYNFEPSQHRENTKRILSMSTEGEFSQTSPSHCLITSFLTLSQILEGPSHIVDPSSTVGTSNVELSVVDCVW